MFLDAMAIAFWPMVIGLLLAGWLGRTNQTVVVVTWVPAALIIIAGIVHTSIEDIASPVVLLDSVIGMILFGALLVVTAYGCGSSLTQIQRVGSGLLGVALIAFGSHELIGDHVLERRAVDGVVRQLRIHQTARGPNDYLVTIGTETFKAPTRLYATLRQGERVRATIGRGSGYIYGMERL